MSLHRLDSRISTAYINDGGSGGGYSAPVSKDEDTSIFAGVEGFDKWSNSETPQDDFAMFDIDLSTYSKDLKNFAQSYIDNYDSDEDSYMSFNEFVTMASNGEQNPELLSVASQIYNNYKEVYEKQIIPPVDADNDGSLNSDEFLVALGYDPQTVDQKTRKEVDALFNSLNTDNKEGNENQLLSSDELLVGLNPELDGINSQVLQNQTEMYNMFASQYSELDIDGDGQISSGEWASMLYAADLDWENYAQTGDVASSIDGKLNWENYQAMPLITKGMSGYETLKQEKEAFFDNFYAS